ncbi:hypothetical protein L2E82_19102 [Cichorium intybus]|uniref:Uncharacterized protein n=1 Tax=Cichorium intybus TaxID=13427 RepID=A0ACB9FCL3_CICIN|nr:hypothetical protein L2E82_19102 [Cichorium intybus]
MASSSRTYSRGSKRQIVYSASSGSSDEEPEQQDFDMGDAGIAFMTDAQEARFYNFLERTGQAQKFVDVPTLRDLHIEAGVRKLLSNIGWEGLMNISEKSYSNPTIEFLSSVEFNVHTTVLSFRMFNRSHQITQNQLCELIGAPVANTYDQRGKLNKLFHREVGPFWTRISTENFYRPSAAKASSIIHPVLKVTHRIIASILFPQEEISKAGLNELELLYCMINPGPKTPNFGSWIMYKLLKLSRSSSGQLHCGGIITLIAKHPALGIRFPDNLEIVRGERYLTSDVLEGMRLFRRPQSDEIWQADGRDYLRVNNRNARILRLANPVSTTNWKPPSNMGIQLPAPNLPPREPSPPPRQPQEPGPSSSASSFPPEHSLYMEQFSSINSQLADLRLDYQGIYDNLGEIDTHQMELRHDFEQFRENQYKHNQDVMSILSDIQRSVAFNPWQQQQPLQPPQQQQQPGSQPLQPPQIPPYPYYPPYPYPPFPPRGPFPDPQ